LDYEYILLLQKNNILTLPNDCGTQSLLYPYYSSSLSMLSLF